MKINELAINEGPIWQGVKGAAGALKGAVSNAVASGKAGYQQSQGQQSANQVAALNIKQWNQAVGQLAQSGATPTVDQLVAFVKQRASTANVPPPQDLSNQQAVNDYITKSISQHLANTKLGSAPQAQPAQATTPQAQPAQEPAQPAKPSGNAMAEKLAKDWQAFVQAGGNAGPALKQQIKQMWLDAGGIRAESKKNKKQPV